MSSFIRPASSLRSPAASLISPQACSPLPFISSIFPSPCIRSLSVRLPTPCLTFPLPWSNIPSARSRVLLSFMASISFCLNRGKCVPVLHQSVHEPCHRALLSIYESSLAKFSVRRVGSSPPSAFRGITSSLTTRKHCLPVLFLPRARLDDSADLMQQTKSVFIDPGL